MNIRNNVLLYTLLLAVLLLSGWTIYGEIRNRRVAYIDVERLVNSYDFKKDIEKDASKNLFTIQHAIDSLQLIRKTMNQPIPNHIDSQLARAKYVYEEYYNASTKQMNQRIWERLNPVIQEYGKEKGLELLIGATGNGSLLYADKGRDMTDDLADYINKKYEKGS